MPYIIQDMLYTNCETVEKHKVGMSIKCLGCGKVTWLDDEED